MKSPIQADGASQDKAADPTKLNVPDDHPSIHDTRAAIMDAAADRLDEERAAGREIAGDSGVEDAQQAEREDALDGIRGKDGYVPDRSKPAPEKKEPEPGLTKQQPLHEAPEPEQQQVPAELADDPLADFLVMDEETNEIFVQAKVNGKEELIPFEKAKAYIQKHDSADKRLQEATSFQRSLNERAARIEQQEKDLQSRLQQMHTPKPEEQPSPADAGLNDDEIAEQAAEVVAGLFTEDQEKATAKLVDLLKKTRGAPATPIDPQKIAQDAVTAAREQLTAEERARDATAGYTAFADKYQDILADEGLFKYADGLTDAIAKEHPEWKPSEVMLEAGKRTREWVQNVRGESPPDDTSEQHDQTTQDRQERKRQLRPVVPRLRQGTQPREEEERPDTPADIVAEVRRSRGQSAA